LNRTELHFAEIVNRHVRLNAEHFLSMVQLKSSLGNDRGLCISCVHICFGFLGSSIEIVAHLFIKNESDQAVDEAEVHLPLVEGSYVCGYAVDIDGILMDAQIVSKEKAIKTYGEEAKTFHKSKTSIVEQEGNVFKIKLNFLPPRGERQMKITIMDKLDAPDSANCYEHLFPFDLPRAASVTFASTLLSTTAAPVANPPTITLESNESDDTSYDLACQVGRFFCTGSISNISLRRIRYIACILFFCFLPLFFYNKIKSELILISRHRFEATPIQTEQARICGDGSLRSCLFIGRDLIRLSNGARLNDELGGIASCDKTVLVVWDVSLSQGINAEKKNREADMRLMTTMIGKWKNQRRFQEVHILLFNDSVQQYVVMKVAEKNKILDFLRGVTYEGGTNYSALVDYLKDKPQGAFSLCLFFTNGFDTFGNSNNVDLFRSSNSALKTLPLFFCCSSENRNKTMNSWANSSGGDVSLCPISRTDYAPTEIEKVGNFSKKMKFLFAKYDMNLVTCFYPASPTVLDGNILDFTGTFSFIILFIFRFFRFII
jgi:hypothetical protein